MEVERGDGIQWINNMVVGRFTKNKKRNSSGKRLLKLGLRNKLITINAQHSIDNF